MLSAAEAAFGDLSADAGADDGATVQLDVEGDESARRGWAFAQWAVASADGLDIVAVATDGKRWERDPRDVGADDGAPGAGTVSITVANGQ